MDQWNRTTKLLHWLVALLLLVTASMGWLAVTEPMSPLKLQLFVLHKSLGITVLALVLIRLVWRALSRPPARLSQFSSSQRRSVAAGHALLYGVMIALPLTGWLLTSAANFPFRWFGGPDVPLLWPSDEPVADLASLAHHYLFYLLLLLTAGHVGFALWHAHRGLPVLPRMFPLRPSPGLFILAILSLALITVVLLRVLPVYSVAGSKAEPGSIAGQHSAVPEAPGTARQPGRESQPGSEQRPASEPLAAVIPDPAVYAEPAEQHVPTLTTLPTVTAAAKSHSTTTDATATVAEAPSKTVLAKPAPPLWTMPPGQGTLAFIGDYTGAEFRGHFRRFAPRILFSPDNLAAASIEVDIDVTSATLGSADMDEMLPEAEWFDFARFPRARFSATGFKRSAQGFITAGELLLKGRLQPVLLYLEWQTQSEHRAHLRAQATLNRVAFGIGSGEWAADASIGFDVQVKAELLLQRDANAQ